jgi:hypothetical protein
MKAHITRNKKQPKSKLVDYARFILSLICMGALAYAGYLILFY